MEQNVKCTLKKKNVILKDMVFPTSTIFIATTRKLPISFLKIMVRLMKHITNPSSSFFFIISCRPLLQFRSGSRDFLGLLPPPTSLKSPNCDHRWFDLRSESLVRFVQLLKSKELWMSFVSCNKCSYSLLWFLSFPPQTRGFFFFFFFSN